MSIFLILKPYWFFFKFLLSDCAIYWSIFVIVINQIESRNRKSQIDSNVTRIVLVINPWLKYAFETIENNYLNYILSPISTSSYLNASPRFFVKQTLFDIKTHGSVFIKQILLIFLTLNPVDLISWLVQLNFFFFNSSFTGYSLTTRLLWNKDFKKRSFPVMRHCHTDRVENTDWDSSNVCSHKYTIANDFRDSFSHSSTRFHIFDDISRWPIDILSCLKIMRLVTTNFWNDFSHLSTR